MKTIPAQDRAHPKYAYKIMQSPVGSLKLIATDTGLTAIVWADKKPGLRPNRTRAPAAHEQREDAGRPVLRETGQQLAEYFAKKRTKFDLKLDLQGTDFQKRVWKALLDIPFGTTVSYADIARKIGKPKAVRAVGSANNKNPICIIAACHRVVSSSGALAGYAGGLDTKAALLAHESVAIEPGAGKITKDTKIAR